MLFELLHNTFGSLPPPAYNVVSIGCFYVSSHELLAEKWNDQTSEVLKLGQRKCKCV